MAQKCESVSPTSRLSKSSGYGSMEDSKVTKETETPVSKHAIESADELATPVKLNAEVKPKPIQQSKKEDRDSAIGDLDESKDDVFTTVSEKSKIRKLAKEQPIVTDAGRRVKSASENRAKQLESIGDTMHKNAEEGRQPRSRSALGGSRMEQTVDDIAPMPYMDHSKPRVVSVGSIGKISLLESISEAKFWEDMAQDKQKDKKAIETESEKQPEQPDEDEELHKLDEAINVATVVEDNNIAVNDIAVEPVDEVIEGRISSQSNRPKKKGKRASIANDLEDIGADDLLALILEEEKRRRKLQKAHSRRHSFNFCSSAKSSSSSSSSRRSNRARLGSSASYSSKSSSDNKPQENREVEDDKKDGQELARKNSIPLEYRSVLKSPEKAHKGGPEKHVVLRTVSELNKEKVKTFNKYERLIKRLGDDMAPYMKSQMLKVA